MSMESHGETQTGMKLISEFFRTMDEIVAPALYPPHVVKVPARIAGTAFFPGGSGLYLEGRDANAVEFPFGGVMILGHNFDSETGFRESLLRGRGKLESGTWRSLIALLTAAQVPVEQCFFTNAFMGLCSGDNRFEYRGRDDERFRAACLSFLGTQIAFQQPSLILTLGLHVPPILAQLSPDLSRWRGPKLHLRDLDAQPLEMAARFELNGGSVHKAVVVPIAHPCLPNGGTKNPRGFSAGKQGEIELLRDGWRAVGRFPRRLFRVTLRKPLSRPTHESI